MTIPSTQPDTPSHGTGVRKGESRAEPLAQRPTRKANDATGINLENRGPISPKMPNLPPA